MMEKSTFCEVFKKVHISQPVLRVVGDSIVEKISISPKTKIMSVELSASSIVDESSISVLKAELKRAFPLVENINVRLRYNLGNTDLATGMKKYWLNILYNINCISPMCYKLLQKANWFVEENNLHIKIKNSSFYFFTKKGMDKKIQEMLDISFGKNVRVFFDLEKNDPVADEQYNIRLSDRVKEIVENVSKNTPVNSNSDTAGTGNSYSRTANGDDAFSERPRARKKMKLRDDIKGKIVPLLDKLEIESEILVQGEIFDFEQRETKKGKYLLTMDITDGSNSLSIKFFLKPEDYDDEFKSLIAVGNVIKAKGRIQYDDYSNELNMMAFEICEGVRPPQRIDDSEEKRVELHLHTQMSAMDGISTAKAYIKRALEWGHKAIAITDHGVVQAFPEAMETAAGKGIKIIYGVEAYLVDDLGAVVQGVKEQTLSDCFVVFDLETTGLSKEKDAIIEVGAVKIKDGVIIDSFESFVNPGVSLSQEIIKLTGITDDMLVDAKRISEVLPDFLDFIENNVLVAHNAGFDVGFISVAATAMGQSVENTVLDTLELSRTLFPNLNKHKLNIVAEHLGVSLENHHRAVDDAKATAEIFLKCSEILREKGISALSEINLLASNSIDVKKLKYRHAIILAKNLTGLRNLYELISISHIEYFYRRPRIPKSRYIQFKEGLIIGTACEAGELYTAVKDNKSDKIIKELAEFYDYFEIQPTGNNMYLVREEIVSSVQELQNINKKIIALGERYQKPVVATCDAHFLNPEDEVYRRIIMAGDNFKDADLQAPLFYRTTKEMLKEFDYLGEKVAREVVITNTNLIADSIEEILPIPKGTYAPKIEGAEQQLKDITMKRATELYGETLPPIVAERLERELHSIIKNGFSVMYIVAQMLVWKSVSDGYLVGSRGSVGSSFVATMAGITEVNPLPPHYLCPNCKYSDFDSEIVKGFARMSGCDMPDMNCPSCGCALSKDGHEIPFETFLGFDGDKEPDIDLNFSGEYQSKAHDYTEEIFGKGHVFKAGTIGTLADKTAYGYVKKYMEARNIQARNAEINRLKKGCTGIKKTTGQHPGGLVIVPSDYSIYQFCPVQRPANDTQSNVTTTHFDYHSISGRLLKLDILGHDVPTIIRMLHDITGFDPTTVDIGNKDVMSLFTSPKVLGVTAEDIRCKTGTLGLPEFGTSFVRQMLLDTKPSTFSELIGISGLSHGTDVWLNNAQDLVKDGTTTLKEVISTRDDIMVYLINKGVEKLTSFKIMEKVRKGMGLRDDEEKVMQEANVPEWYIESCKKVKYLFPKGHAVAYVMMTMRIAYFKIFYPYSFYAANFYVKADDFDYELMCLGKENVESAMDELNALGKEATAKDKGTLTILELVLEMYARGLKFATLDLYKSEAIKFTVTEEGLLPPLCSLQGMGINAAQSIVEARGDGEFDTIQDFKERTKINKTVVELLKKNGILKGMTETDQLSLF